MTDMAIPLVFTDAAANKVKNLVADEDNPELKLRVYITGGGCSGFQYGFTFDEKISEFLPTEINGLVVFHQVGCKGSGLGLRLNLLHQ